MDEASRAYLAGFFDGEGNIGVYRSRSHGYSYTVVVLQTVQKDREILEALCEMTGLGRISVMRPGTPEQVWLWRIQNRPGVIAFVDLVAPYSRVKRTALLLAQECANLPPGDPRRDEIRELLRVRPYVTKRSGQKGAPPLS